MIELKAVSINPVENHTVYLGGFLGDTPDGIGDEVFEYLSSESIDTCTYKIICEFDFNGFKNGVKKLDIIKHFYFLDFIIIRELADIAETGEDLFILEEHCQKFNISLIVLDLNLDTAADNGKELLESCWAIYEMCRDFKSGSNTFPEEI